VNDIQFIIVKSNINVNNSLEKVRNNLLNISYPLIFSYIPGYSFPFLPVLSQSVNELILLQVGVK